MLVDILHFLGIAPDLTDVGAILLTGIGAISVAIWGIISQRSITRRQMTIQHINQLDNDKDYIEAVRKFVELAKEGDGLAIWAAGDKEKTTEAQSIRIVLNAFELIAIGIQAGAIDLKMYRQWHKSSVLLFWKHAEPFVYELRRRTERQKLFIEFQMLVERFSGKKPETRNWWTGNFW